MIANPLTPSSFYDRTDLVVSASSFQKTLNLLRSFFLGKNYIEAHTQSRLSILAACEDPKIISMGMLARINKSIKFFFEFIDD